MLHRGNPYITSLRITSVDCTSRPAGSHASTIIQHSHFPLSNSFAHRRKLCLKQVPIYSTTAASPDAFGARSPICVDPKPKHRKHLQNVFLDDCGFPDQSDEYDHVLHHVKGGAVLRKLKHPKPDLEAPPDPAYHSTFFPEKHKAKLRKDIDLSHLKPNLQEEDYNMIQEFWSVFNGKGVFVPVKNYECVINTGTARPIAVKKILYGECESVIMRRCIAALVKVGHICQITDGQWLFKPLLATKPHQESVYNIDDFVWRFCVNYIPLNSVTLQITYPIPGCDSVVFNEFGNGKWMWMFDAPMGYHQLAVEKSSQEKLAFQGVDAIKWTYTIMPFGPMNRPATFINFIHDINSVWKEEAQRQGVSINNVTNMKIIIDGIVSWADHIRHALTYMRCCQAYNLSLNLHKSSFFLTRFEFIGVNVCKDGNCPAQSKHGLLKSWPAPELVCDIVKLIGFAQFYSRFIPNFEIRAEPLRHICKQEYTKPIAAHWTPEAEGACEDLKEAIMSESLHSTIRLSQVVHLAY